MLTPGICHHGSVTAQNPHPLLFPTSVVVFVSPVFVFDFLQLYSVPCCGFVITAANSAMLSFFLREA